MTKSMLTLLGVAGLAAGAWAADPPADAKAIAAPLEGGYTIVSGERDGKAIPEERIKGSVVRFTAAAITGTDKDKKEFFACTFTLDKDKSPWVIRMKSTAPKAGDEAVGLIKIEGDTLTLIYALPGGDAPTEFKTKDKQHLFVLKNQNKAADSPRTSNKFVPEGGSPTGPATGRTPGTPPPLKPEPADSDRPGRVPPGTPTPPVPQPQR